MKWKRDMAPEDAVITIVESLLSVLMLDYALKATIWHQGDLSIGQVVISTLVFIGAAVLLAVSIGRLIERR